MSLDTGAILAALRSEAQRLGKFDKVRGHESKNAPGRDLSLDQWVRSCRPAPAASGLAASSAVLVVDLRIYRTMLAKPEDQIDPDVCAAADAIIGGVAANFTLDGLIRNVDIHNAHGGGFLGWVMGYLTIGQNSYRAAVVTVPMIVSDAWPQVATR